MTPEELPEIKRVSPHGGCRACAGRQFVGRTAIFELAAGPAVRQALAKQVDLKTLRQAAVNDGMRPFSEEGVATVAAGVSSLDEIQRVLASKPATNKEASKEAGAAAGAKPGAKPIAKPSASPGAKPTTKPGAKPANRPGDKK